MDTYVAIANQIFEIEQKLIQENLVNKFDRNLRRLKSTFEELGLIVINPMGEKYSESRTDYKASIVGKVSTNMVITQVIKPIIYQAKNGERTLLQKGIVIVGT